MHSAQMSSTDTLTAAAAAFTAIRPRLLRLARRIVGNTAEAEDVVQDTWLRWQNTDRTRVQDPPAFLTRITVRLALNVTRSARVRHETGFGPSAAEPVDTGADPAVRAERAEALDAALCLLVERLGRTERAAYVLRVAFDCPYSQIAEDLRISQVNTRQIVSRARKHLAGGRRTTVSPGEGRRFREAFAGAARSGDLSELRTALICS